MKRTLQQGVTERAVTWIDVDEDPASLVPAPPPLWPARAPSSGQNARAVPSARDAHPHP